MQWHGIVVYPKSHPLWIRNPWKVRARKSDAFMLPLSMVVTSGQLKRLQAVWCLLAGLAETDIAKVIKWHANCYKAECRYPQQLPRWFDEYGIPLGRPDRSSPDYKNFVSGNTH